VTLPWVPEREWDGEDVYVLGGGPSLRIFDWDRIRSRKVIGCNGAYLLGSQVVDIVVFGDVNWWKTIGCEGTKHFGGRVVGSTPNLLRPVPWLLQMTRQQYGLGAPGLGRLAWNRNTGSLGINLALLLGARRVYLLGFDMSLSARGEANWHDERCEPARAEVYARFRAGFAFLASALPETFPGVEVVNLHASATLPMFPTQPLDRHFAEETRTCQTWTGAL
jgi:hypothetical protein